jgi:hypothetical protein
MYLKGTFKQKLMWKRKYRIQLRTKQKEGEGNFPLYKEKRNDNEKR